MTNDDNAEKLIEVFAELEFKSLGKRILGDEFNVFQTAPAGVQTDLFGQPVEIQKSKDFVFNNSVGMF